MRVKAYRTSRGETRSIFIRLSYGSYEETRPSDIYPNGRKYRRIEYYTGKTVKAKDFDVAKGETKNNSFLNAQIAKGIVRIKNIYSEHDYNGKVDFYSLREAIKNDVQLNELFNKEREIVVETDYIAPMDFIKTFMEKVQVTSGTKKNYLNTYNHLEDFQKYTGKNLTWKSMGYEFYLDLVEFLKTEKNHKGSNIDKVIKNIKVFLNYADLQDNLNVNQDFKKTVSGKSLFAKVSREEAEHVYLNEREIKQITDTRLDENLSGIRDLFLIGCWTGLRISDLKRLQMGNIKDGLLSITAQKTLKNVTIPITDELQAVLNIYPDRLPKIPTDQHYNREIKKVCEVAKINEPIMTEERKGKMRVTSFKPKYELITSHTARRSFATNLYRRGIPSTQLMMLTGHKSETSFMKYIKVSGVDNAKDVAMKLKKIG